MGVEKMSVSFDLKLGAAIKKSARERSVSVSSWLAEAARDRLRRQALGDAIEAWERAHGSLTEDELTQAEAQLEGAAKTKRAAK